jgi:predicted dehydrogenase
MGGGGFADNGSHWVDLALWLGGAPAVEVVALAESAGLSIECYLNLQARLANGVLLSLTSADGIPASRNRLAIYGDQGMLTAEWDGGPPEIALHRAQGSQPLETDLADSTPTAAFVDTILDGAPNLAPADEAAHAVALTAAAYRSIAEGRIVHVDVPG